jgi:hypothetical protein
MARGEIRAGTSATDLPYAVANLSVPVAGEGAAYSQRMVALLIDGPRFGASTSHGGSGVSSTGPFGIILFLVGTDAAGSGSQPDSAGRRDDARMMGGATRGAPGR